MGTEKVKAATNWRKPEKDYMPKGEVLLLTTSKVIIIGDWYGDRWRTGLTLLKFEDIIAWQELPEIIE